MKTDDDISQMPMWKSYLYHLQQQAPKPKRIPCQKDVPNRPPYYGREYHGPISREDADFMLTIGGEGSYLIRESQRAPGQYTLAIRFDGVTKNFKLYFDNQHYVGEKRFDNINDLVADGLITFYLESKAADYIASLSNQSNYAESPYVAYNTHKKHHQHTSSAGVPKRPPRGAQGVVPVKRQEPPDPQQSSSAEPRFASPRSSSDITSPSSTGDSSASSSGIVGRPNIPIERTRLSQMAEQRRSQDSQQLQQHQQKLKQHADDTKNFHPSTPSGKPLPPTPGSNRQPSAHRGIPVPQVDASRVTSSTNTEGPMLEDQQFLTPPSSPPSQTSGLSMVDAPSSSSSSSRQINNKLSSVTWCTDYFEVISCEKPHNFKLYTFKGPHWCDYCANFLWGLIAQGVKCQDCGFNAHKKCSEKVPNDCMPDMKYVKRVFGIDLTTLVKAQSTLIPAVVEMCVKEIESRGLDSEGLYRVAGFHDDVEAIRMSFDKDGELTDISEERYDDLNTIASVLKLYFRLLPIPLVTFDVYFKVIDIVRREDLVSSQKLDLIKHSIELLPPAHYHTLKYLVSHLHRVTEHQQQNMMNAENLAIVFAPTLLRSPETDPLFSLSAVKYERELIELMIINHSMLFV